MKRLLTALPLALLISACGQEQNAPQTSQAEAPEPAQETVVEANEKHSGLLVEYMDLEVRPGDDFNAFVNGGWMATAEIPADRSSAGVGLEVHEQSQENVKIIIEESAEGDFPQGSDEQKVGDLYNSYMDMETRNAKGVEPLRSELDRIRELEDYADLAVYFADANKTFFVTSISRIPTPT